MTAVIGWNVLPLSYLISLIFISTINAQAPDPSAVDPCQGFNLWQQVTGAPAYCLGHPRTRCQAQTVCDGYCQAQYFDLITNKQIADCQLIFDFPANDVYVSEPTPEPSPHPTRMTAAPVPTFRPSLNPTEIPQPCPGILFRDPVTNICTCPTKTPDGLWLPVCTPPAIQNPTTCDCELPSIPSGGGTGVTANPMPIPNVPIPPNPADPGCILPHCQDPCAPYQSRLGIFPDLQLMCKGYRDPVRCQPNIDCNKGCWASFHERTTNIEIINCEVIYQPKPVTPPSMNPTFKPTINPTPIISAQLNNCELPQNPCIVGGIPCCTEGEVMGTTSCEGGMCCVTRWNEGCWTHADCCSNMLCWNGKCLTASDISLGFRAMNELEKLDGDEDKPGWGKYVRIGVEVGGISWIICTLLTLSVCFVVCRCRRRKGVEKEGYTGASSQSNSSEDNEISHLSHWSHVDDV